MYLCLIIQLNVICIELQHSDILIVSQLYADTNVVSSGKPSRGLLRWAWGFILFLISLINVIAFLSAAEIQERNKAACTVKCFLCNSTSYTHLVCCNNQNQMEETSSFCLWDSMNFECVRVFNLPHCCSDEKQSSVKSACINHVGWHLQSVCLCTDRLSFFFS